VKVRMKFVRENELGACVRFVRESEVEENERIDERESGS